MLAMDTCIGTSLVIIAFAYFRPTLTHHPRPAVSRPPAIDGRAPPGRCSAISNCRVCSTYLLMAVLLPVLWTSFI